MYLSRPATSCSSERAFKSAGIIYNEERASLNTETVERIVFIKENIHLLPKENEELTKLIHFNNSE